jgi:hypothetical protein
METIWKEDRNSNGRTVIDRLSNLEEELKLEEAKSLTEKETKKVKWTGKFRRTFTKNPKKLDDKIIVLCFNSKREIEEPVILPIISGGLVVYRDKGFKFDTKSLYTIKIGNKINRVLALEEDDRLPIGHKDRYRQIAPQDIEELKKQGRYTRNDPILLKMLWNAQIEKVQKKAMQMSWLIWVVLIAIAGIVIYMFTKG